MEQKQLQTICKTITKLQLAARAAEGVLFNEKISGNVFVTRTQSDIKISEIIDILNKVKNNIEKEATKI